MIILNKKETNSFKGEAVAKKVESFWLQKHTKRAID